MLFTLSRKDPVEFFYKGILFAPVSILDFTGTTVRYKTFPLWDASIFAFRRPETFTGIRARRWLPVVRGVESVKMRGKSSYTRGPISPHASEWVYR